MSCDNSGMSEAVDNSPIHPPAVALKATEQQSASTASTRHVAPDRGPEIQALCRWQSPESLAIYVRLQPREAISMLDAAQNATITSYSTVNLPCFKASHLSDAISVQCGNDGDKDRNGTFALT